MPANPALFQLGMDLDTVSSTARTEEAIDERGRLAASEDAAKDHFIVRDGVEYAGTHLIIDVIGGSRLDDLELIEMTLRECVEAASATLLHIHLHHFTPNGGVSGVAVLAESHISVHTWPERNYAAFDVFMCGDAEPHRTIDILREAFEPSHMVIEEHLRGRGA